MSQPVVQRNEVWEAGPNEVMGASQSRAWWAVPGPGRAGPVLVVSISGWGRSTLDGQMEGQGEEAAGASSSDRLTSR